MNRPRVQVAGWVLAELVIVLAVLTILAPAIESLMVTSIRAGGRMVEELRAERHIAAAEAAVLELARRGVPPEGIAAELRARFPELQFSVDDAICRVSPRDTLTQRRPAARAGSRP